MSLRPDHPARSAYDRLAAFYDQRWSKYVQATLEPLGASLELRGNERVLDIGCGTGELERLLLERWSALHLVGSDLSLEMLRVANGKRLAG